MKTENEFKMAAPKKTLMILEKLNTIVEQKRLAYDLGISVFKIKGILMSGIAKEKEINAIETYWKNFTNLKYSGPTNSEGHE